MADSHGLHILCKFMCVVISKSIHCVCNWPRKTRNDSKMNQKWSQRGVYYMNLDRFFPIKWILGLKWAFDIVNIIETAENDEKHNFLHCFPKTNGREPYLASWKSFYVSFVGIKISRNPTIYEQISVQLAKSYQKNI